MGTVQWVSAGRLQLWTNAGAVSVDVSRVDQSDYAGLRAGEVVRVIGHLAPDRIRVVAETIERDVWPGPQTP
jgi:CRP-like cAMP-binding protein